ncbi:chromosome segregation protein SMC [Marinicella rhabdoformis]|uniref:chromosome segregation protein SMC n=1 Tax=Marinicella rhabdoformis TaxID=2580566 RepID=UPI0012AEBCFC|nr:chromosome segregation protein SMC [Marinicella rhabdoformis]
MRLSKIKIAGFKSFVDPTEVLLPSNLIGVVGPNGCGKSNIIDAVRWVMGETSAKMLRGASMTDVIFTGSASRKPVSLATVELLFDNSDGQIQGEFATYNEISVKRQVNRDSQSFYYLNGNKCRKKDIVDLFLGTGLGPRSYSIIEQGMISQIVESKAEDLRGYIEEAAGVSKYRDRRRETERRIKRTRENLERLDDLRTEVGKHIQHLQRQAKNAERYKKLKEQYKVIRAEVLALRWHQWNQQAEGSEAQVNQLKTALEQARSGQTDGEKNIEAQRAAHQALVDENNKVQERLYHINSEIGKIEQAIAHSKALSERHKLDLEQTEHGISRAQEQIETDQAQFEEQQMAIENLTPEIEALEMQLEEIQAIHEESESGQEQWRTQWDENAQALNEKNRTIEVERTKIQSLEQQVMRSSERLQMLLPIDGESEDVALHADLEHLQEQNELQQAKHESLEEALIEAKEAQQQLDQQGQLLRQTIDQCQEQLHQNKGRRGSLLALQQAAQAKDNPALKQWLADNPKLQSERLSDLIKVEAGWELAVETVLQDRLQAFVTDQQDWQTVMKDWTFGAATTVQNSQGHLAANKGTLSECVKAPDAVLDWFNSIKICPDLSQAQSLVNGLAAGESVVTADGHWLSQHWLHINQGGSEDSFLLRQKALKQLDQNIETDEVSLQQAQQDNELVKANKVTQQGQIEQLQLDVNMSHRKLSELNGLILNKQQMIEQLKKQAAQKDEESNQVRKALANDEAAIKTSRALLEQAMNDLVAVETNKLELQQQQQGIQGQYQQSKSQLNDISTRYYQQKIGLAAHQNKAQALQQGMTRTQDNLAQLTARKDQLLQQMSQDLDPMSGKQNDLEQLIADRISTEKIRDEKRQTVQQSQSELDQLERARSAHQSQIDQARSALEQANLTAQSNKMKATGFYEQLKDQGFHAAQMVEDMEEAGQLSQNLDQQVADKEEQVERLNRGIVRLEPVNLAAIEEFEEESKRKAYLDEQNSDLEAALGTLEDAIARIDKDTRTLFKETFETVNNNIKEIFPRLFGGGHAYLELTGNDLLTTGVTIMARPPGKRVSSIQLLSGGEKALTAVSLVFAIFNLNPAPFCMLDEVDAPLDDANVSRFSAMVAEMSEKVQFLFVTHNKVTMEIANQLMGVTMREAGVSRLVSVDLAEAEEMALQ